MKESMWGYLIIALGVVIVAVLLLVQNMTATNEQDYYLSRELLKSSMFDAIDYGTYMKSGKLVMSREKFVSIFTRRFAESVNPDRTYKLEFYDIYEYPPKATIRIKTNTGETTVNNDSVDIEVNTFITGILETTEYSDGYGIVFSTSNGDFNGDGNLSVEDINAIAEYIKLNGGNCTSDKKTVIDVNNDGKCNNTDLIILRKALYSGVPLDVDGNGTFDAEDVSIVDKCVNATGGINNCSSTLSERAKVVADTDNDGDVDANDLETMKKALSFSN